MSQREIKFRAWEIEDRHMSHRVLIDIREMLTAGKIVVIPTGQYILLQYTGLKDKNGKEIYEGDIIKFALFEPGIEVYDTSGGPAPTHVAVVRWSHYVSGFAPMAKRPMDFDTIEVIGNIYENPELLRGKT